MNHLDQSYTAWVRARRGEGLDDLEIAYRAGQLRLLKSVVFPLIRPPVVAAELSPTGGEFAKGDVHAE